MENKEDERIRIPSELVDLGIRHFQNIYKEHNRVNIAQILKMASFFPSFVSKKQI